jgi:hypothetical protein
MAGLDMDGLCRRRRARARPVGLPLAEGEGPGSLARDGKPVGFGTSRPSIRVPASSRGWDCCASRLPFVEVTPVSSRRRRYAAGQSQADGRRWNRT